MADVKMEQRAEGLTQKQMSELLLRLAQQNTLLMGAMTAAAEVLAGLIISQVANSSAKLPGDIKQQKIDDAKDAFDDFISIVIAAQETEQELVLGSVTSGHETSERLEDEG